MKGWLVISKRISLVMVIRGIVCGQGQVSVGKWFYPPMGFLRCGLEEGQRGQGFRGNQRFHGLPGQGCRKWGEEGGVSEPHGFSVMTEGGLP